MLQAIQNAYPLFQFDPLVLWDEEAFPNADKLFEDAFELPDPTAELLNLINAHPTGRAVRDLLINYIAAVEDNPYRANALVSILVALRDSPDAPAVIHDPEGDFNLALALRVQLAELHSRYLYVDKDDATFSPTNSYLINCLLSALSLKYHLASSHIQYHEIKIGLDAHGDKPIHELFVVAACIQLLTIGSEIVLEKVVFNHTAEEVAAKLKSLQSEGVVKDPSAQRLLELTISHAENGFKKEDDVDDVWEWLFPSQHEAQLQDGSDILINTS